MAVLAIITPAFFIILYSMEWGAERSNAWLTSYILSAVESLFITDPIKVPPPLLPLPPATVGWLVGYD